MKQKYIKIRSPRALYDALKAGKDIFYAKAGEWGILFEAWYQWSADDYSQFSFIDVYESIQKGQVWVKKWESES